MSSPRIAAYMAAGSVAAMGMAYVMGANPFASAAADPARAVTGLANPANDCFINSVLQALAGLPRLRRHLDGDGKAVTIDPRDERLPHPPPMLVTDALLHMTNVLNQRSRKTVSSRPFVVALETAFRSRISRRQQDAQEFLQLVLERLCDEQDAVVKAARSSKHTIEDNPSPLSLAAAAGTEIETPGSTTKSSTSDMSDMSIPDVGATEAARVESGITERHFSQPQPAQLPFKGKLESHIQCQVCGCRPKPSVFDFVTLTLNVPQASSTTLFDCLDTLLKTEKVDGYKCTRCCLQFALKVRSRDLDSCRDDGAREALTVQIGRIEAALRDNVEDLPSDVEMPDDKTLPRSQISKHVEISQHPGVLAIHLSRSIFDSGTYSRKNYAKVEFPEKLELGALEGKRYRLMSCISHRGSHGSGHYETFRRQGEASSTRQPESECEKGCDPQAEVSVEPPRDTERNGRHRRIDSTESAQQNRKKKHRGARSKWWRISDETVGQCKTADVLAMQKEAYLLFYESVETDMDWDEKRSWEHKF